MFLARFQWFSVYHTLCGHFDMNCCGGDKIKFREKLSTILARCSYGLVEIPLSASCNIHSWMNYIFPFVSIEYMLKRVYANLSSRIKAIIALRWGNNVKNCQYKREKKHITKKANQMHSSDAPFFIAKAGIVVLTQSSFATFVCWFHRGENTMIQGISENHNYSNALSRNYHFDEGHHYRN